MLAEQTGLDVDSVRAAVKRLDELGIVEIAKFKQRAQKHYGPNTRWIRVRWEVVEENVKLRMQPRIARPRRQKNTEK